MSRLSNLAAFLKAHDDFAVLGHVFPDGDASGSCIAMCLALQKMGKRAFVCLPGGLAAMYQPFMEKDSRVHIVSGNENLPFTPATAFALDISEMQRMGSGLEIFKVCRDKAMLDHHETNQGGGDICFIDGEAASCGELVVELLRELGVELDREMAAWLYVAICTDCGRFGFSSTKPETMIAAADCLRAGVDVDFIHRMLYRTRSEARTRLLGRVLNELQLNSAKTICWASITRETMQELNALPEDKEGIVNYLQEIEGVRMAFLAVERDDASTKFSLRSQPDFDCAANVALPLGGGGHACAAGITLNLPLQEAVQAVLEKAEAALNK